MTIWIPNGGIYNNLSKTQLLSKTQHKKQNRFVISHYGQHNSDNLAFRLNKIIPELQVLA